MSDQKLYIKNMVCNRCIVAVKSELERLNIEYESILLGEVCLKEELESGKKEELIDGLQELGFAMVDNKKGRIIEQIKTLIIELVHYNNTPLRVNLSDYIRDKVALDYNYISNLFSEVEGTTIEKYLIAQKIEKAKELLAYNELSLSEISYQLNYSSVAHLSSQFKKVTGLTPSHYKKIKQKSRKALDKV